MVSLCLAAGFAAGVCHALPGDFFPPAPPPFPAWATQEWIYDAAGIVAGETVHQCATCDQWIACTVIGDVTLRSYHPWRLRLGRWNGWRRPGVRHLKAIRCALEGGCCTTAPVCAYLGSLSDYTRHWRFSFAREQQVFVIGNQYGVLACVPSYDN